MVVEKFRAAHGRLPEIAARAPGRIEFIGNHTDYNGGPVLGAAIDRSVWVGLSRRSDGIRQFRSDHRDAVVEMATDDFSRQSRPHAWVNYPLGVLSALAEAGFRIPAGFDYLAASDLAVGAGLSSSAAIELASALAFLEAAGERVPRETLARVARQAENKFVGVPCGILDQGVSAFGRKNHLVFIDCRGPRFDTVPLPPGAHFWIFNTHTKHALVDGLYAARHAECMTAAKCLGVPWLADITPAGLAATGTALPAIPLRRAKHVINEIARVESTVAALRAGDLPAVGQLLTASHLSSRDLFENSTFELDFLVESLVAAPHVYGARLTGGGFGGAVMALTDGRFDSISARDVAFAYRDQFNALPDVMHLTTADGASLVAV